VLRGWQVAMTTDLIIAALLALLAPVLYALVGMAVRS
jgi:hypothetical protein